MANRLPPPNSLGRSKSSKTEERIAYRCICCGSHEINKSPAILMPFLAKRAFGWEPVEITNDWGLRDIKPGMAYPLCNSVQCSECGLLFLDIRFSEKEMASLYSGYRDEVYTNLRDKFEPGYITRNKLLVERGSYIPKIEEFLFNHIKLPVKILDWGGDTGLNTPFRNQSKLLHIYDISSKPVISGAQKADQDVIKRTKYDIIVFSNVLEHVPFPLQTVAEIRSAMRNETVLYIEVPHEELIRLNPSSRSLHTKKKHWHEHINFFTQESLNALLKKCGLDVIDIASIEMSAGGKDGYVFAIACKLQ